METRASVALASHPLCQWPWPITPMPVALASHLSCQLLAFWPLLLSLDAAAGSLAAQGWGSCPGKLGLFSSQLITAAALESDIHQ